MWWISEMTSGVYKISGLLAGTYKVRDVRPSGWTQTSPASNGAITVALGAGQNFTGKNFFIRPTPGGTATRKGPRRREKPAGLP